TLMLIPVAVWVNNKLVEPRLGKYSDSQDYTDTNTKVSLKEKKGVLWASISVVIFVIILLIALLPENAILRNPDTGSIIEESPFMESIVPLTMILFLIPSIIFGLITDVFKSDKDIVGHLNKSISGMGTFIVFAFVASQM